MKENKMKPNPPKKKHELNPRDSFFKNLCFMNRLFGKKITNFVFNMELAGIWRDLKNGDPWTGKWVTNWVVGTGRSHHFFSLFPLLFYCYVLSLWVYCSFLFCFLSRKEFLQKGFDWNSFIKILILKRFQSSFDKLVFFWSWSVISVLLLVFFFLSWEKKSSFFLVSPLFFLFSDLFIFLRHPFISLATSTNYCFQKTRYTT